MISLPELLARSLETRRIYVAVKSPPREPLAPAINHMGVITHVEKSPYGPKAPTGTVTVEFWIDSEWRGITAPIENFTILERRDVPQDFITRLNKSENDAAKAFHATEKASARAEKQISRQLSESDARLVHFFQESRNFWKAWKGTGKPPVDPTTGLDATERYHPELEKELYEQALSRIKKPPS